MISWSTRSSCSTSPKFSFQPLSPFLFSSFFTFLFFFSPTFPESYFGSSVFPATQVAEKKAFVLKWSYFAKMAIGGMKRLGNLEWRIKKPWSYDIKYAD